VTVDEAQSPIPEVIATLTRAGAVVSQEEYERQGDEARIRVAFDVRAPVSVQGHDLARALEQSAGVKHIKIERL
jgi:hypothetical protein